MFNKKFIITLIIILLGLSFLYSNPITTIRSNRSDLELFFQIGKYDFSIGDDFTHVFSDDLYYPQISGAAKLPIFSFFVGVPPDGDVEFQLENKKISIENISKPIAPTPTNFIPKGSEVSISKNEIDDELYSSSLKSQLITITEPFFWRNQKVVYVTVNPFKVDNKSVHITEEFLLNLKIKGDTSFRNNFNDINFEKIFRKKLINFEVAKTWQKRYNKDIPDNPFRMADRWFKIFVEQDGIYKITRAELERLGIDLENLDPTSIRIYNGGGYSISRDLPPQQPDFKEIPVSINYFSENDFAVYFYGRDTDGFEMNQDYQQYYNPYTGSNIYWLTYNVSDSKNYNLKANSSINKKARQNLDYYLYKEHLEVEKLRIQPANDHYKPYETIQWYWYDFSSGGTFEKTFNVNVTNLYDNLEQKIYFKLASDDAGGRITVYVNGEEVGSSSTSSYEKYFYGNFFKEGNNTITLEIQAPDTDRLAFDYIDFAYYKNLKLEENSIFYSFPDSSGSYQMKISNVDNDELQIFRIQNFYNYELISDYTVSNDTLYLTDTTTAMSDVEYFVVEAGGYLTPSNIVEKIEPTYYYSYPEDNRVVEVETNQYWLREVDALAGTDLVIITGDEFYEKSKELAYLHSEYDSMKCAVVKLTDLYDEFSWGLPDVVGIRLFLKYAQDYYGINSENKTSYAIFAGDGTNDFREYESITRGKNKFPPFEINLKTSDDYFVYFSAYTIPNMMNGRLPAQTLTEYEILVNKIINYIEEPNLGPWRPKVILCPDDFFKKGEFYEYYHTQELEYYCAHKIKNNSQLEKIYAVEYPFDQSMNKPEVTEDLIKSINEGAAIFLYAGHGGYFVLGDEDYFRATRDISRLDNGNKLNFFIASSCNIGEFDSNFFQSLSEKYLLANKKGGIAAYSATRGTAGHGHCCRIVDSLVINSKNDIRLGEAILIEKGGDIVKNSKVYSLLGDPAIKLAIPPTYSAFKFPEDFTDSLQVRKKAEFLGTFENTPHVYNELFVQGMDSDYFVDYESSKQKNKATVTVTKKGKPIFRGKMNSALKDTFKIEYIVPDDAEMGNYAHLMAYGVNEDIQEDALLIYENKILANDHNYKINGFYVGENPDAPNINLWLENKEFVDGGYASTSPLLIAEISDSNGINITNKPGHRILLTLDNNQEYNVTDNFNYNSGSYTEGSLEYNFENIEPGKHTLSLTVFDNYNKSNNKTIKFQVKAENDVSVRNVLNYPNPVKDETYFTFYLDGNATVDIKIYTIAGKLIKDISNLPGYIGFNKFRWNGLDAEGDVPANGLYFYKIKVNSELEDKTYKLFIQH